MEIKPQFQEPLTIDTLLAKLATMAEIEREVVKLRQANKRLEAELHEALETEYAQQYHYTIVVGEVVSYREIRARDETFHVYGDRFADVLQVGERVFAMGEIELFKDYEMGVHLEFTPYVVRSLPKVAE